MKDKITFSGVLRVALFAYLISVLIAYLLFLFKDEKNQEPESSVISHSPTVSKNSEPNAKLPDFSINADKPKSSAGTFVIFDEEIKSPAIEEKPAPSSPIASFIQEPDKLSTPKTIQDIIAPSRKPEPEVTARTEKPVVKEQVATNSQPAKNKASVAVSAIGNKLLQEFTENYNNANIRRLTKQLDNKIVANGDEDKAALLDGYIKLFERTEKRTIRFLDMGWFGDPDEFVGQGRFDITLRHVGKNNDKHYHGKVFFQARQKNNKTLIQEMNFIYDKK